MTPREKIFERLKGRCAEPAEGVEYSIDAIRYDDPLEVFKASLEAAGGEAVDVTSMDHLEKTVLSSFDENKTILDTRHGVVTNAENIEKTDIAIIEAEFGVAENGAVWIDPKERYPRELLTLSKNLAVLLPRDRIVSTMHEAYARIDFEPLSYALFLSGPSKTADIEQALVIGAHGAIGMKVFLMP